MSGRVGLALVATIAARATLSWLTIPCRIMISFIVRFSTIGLIISFSVSSTISALSTNYVSSRSSFPSDIAAATAAATTTAAAAGTDSRGRATSGTTAATAATAGCILGNSKTSPRPTGLSQIRAFAMSTAIAK